MQNFSQPRSFRATAFVLSGGKKYSDILGRRLLNFRKCWEAIFRTEDILPSMFWAVIFWPDTEHFVGLFFRNASSLFSELFLEICWSFLRVQITDYYNNALSSFQFPGCKITLSTEWKWIGCPSILFSFHVKR